jgi:hypothetical protein
LGVLKTSAVFERELESGGMEALVGEKGKGMGERKWEKANEALDTQPKNTEEVEAEKLRVGKE